MKKKLLSLALILAIVFSVSVASAEEVPCVGCDQDNYNQMIKPKPPTVPPSRY